MDSLFVSISLEFLCVSPVHQKNYPEFIQTWPGPKFWFFFFFFFFFKFKVNFKPLATSLFCALSVHLFARKLKYCVEHQKGRKSCQIDIKIVDSGDLTFSMTAQAERSCASSQAVNGT